MTLTTRLAIAMIALVAIAVSAVGWLSYRNLEQALLQRSRDRIETHSRQLATDLEYYAASATGDVAGFRSAVALHGLVRALKAGGTDPVDGVSEKPWRDRIASRSRPNSKPSPAYSMFRIIGLEDDGRELVRVDRMGPTARFESLPTPACRSEAIASTSRKRSGSARTNLRLAARSGRFNGLIERRTGRHSRRDAGLRGRRQAVRHFHGQCRHAARLRPCQVIGVGRANSLPRQPARRLSRSSGSFARIRLAARQAHRLEADFPHLAAQAGAGKASPRSSAIMPNDPTGSRSRRPFWPAPNGSRSSRPLPNAVFMAPAASIRTPRFWSA